MKIKDKKMIRAFFAVRLPLDMAATLHKKALHRAGSLQNQMRWIVPQQQHITLRFLGECEPSQIEQLIELIDRAVLPMESFDCVTGRFEFFPDANHPRVLALNIHSGQQLNTLMNICDEAANACGMRRELKNFHPHVSLARFKHDQRVNPSHFFNLPSYRMTVTEMVLMLSERSDEGTEYDTFKTFPFQPAPPSP